ncbi:MAG: arginine--tRNA ligase, partial [Candidatus Peribacteraceae bacterium]
MFELRKKLAGISEGILKEKFDISTTVHFDFALDEGRGDLTTSIALQLAKKLQRKPQDVAELIAKSLRAAPGVSWVQVAGSGYVNVALDDEVLSRWLTAVEHACEPKQAGTGDAPIIIDFFGPNIAKPLGIHHILSTVIGQVIINLYRHCGFPVIGWNYPGDWGTQFGKLAVAYQKWGSRKPIGKYTVDELLGLYVRFHKEAETNASLEDDARKEFAKLEAGDSVLRAFREDVVDVTKKALLKLCERLHVKVDRETGESFYEEKMEPILREGATKKVFKKGEGGALIVEF